MNISETNVMNNKLYTLDKVILHENKLEYNSYYNIYEGTLFL